MKYNKSNKAVNYAREEAIKKAITPNMKKRFNITIKSGKAILELKQKEERRCSMCYYGRTDMTDLGTNDYWCGYDLKLNSLDCDKRFKLLPIFEKKRKEK